jgi:hypothetical protein
MTTIKSLLHRIVPTSSNSSPATTPARGDDSVTTGAAMASRGPSEARTQGGGVAAPSAPGRGSEDARSPVIMGASSRKRRRRDRLSRLRTQHRAVSAAVSVVAVGAGAFLFATPAYAASPHWTMISQAAPAEFHPGDTSDFYEVFAVNDGAAATSGPITLTDTLPAGLTVNGIDAYAEVPGGEVTVISIGCEQESVAALTTVACTTDEGVPVGRSLALHITVGVPGAGLSGPLINTADVSGGGASESATASNSTPLTPSSQPVPYGTSLQAHITDSEGATATQAGSHPLSFTTLVDFNVASATPNEHNCFRSGQPPSCAGLNAEAKDVDVALPPGLLGNPTAIPQCSQTQFEGQGFHSCPADTQVGAMYLYFYTGQDQYAPVYNIEPPPGQPAELGFSVSTLTHIPIFFHLRSEGDYGLTADVANINQFDPVRVSLLSIWGFPSDSAHDSQRLGLPPCGPLSHGCPSGVENPRPFLTLPTSCAGAPLPVSLASDSWQNPLSPPPVFNTVDLAGMTGCNKLKFEPKLEARPTTNLADSPSGLHVDLKVPQDNSNPGGGEDPKQLATAHLRDTTVTLPKGLTVNPSSAAGLEGCSPSQIGLTSKPGQTPIRTTTAPAACPDASKLGTVEVDTQLIDHPLPGSVYFATPFQNPFKSLLALYITVDDPQTSTVVKLASKVEIAPDGQLTATLSEAPQVPFEDFKLDFFGGARAPLRTPSVCGTYKTTSELTPWSAPESGPPATPADSYKVEAGPNGQPCPASEAAEPNSPSFEAGTASPLAGAYSPFSLHLHREDGSQVFSALNVNLPPGLVGKLAGVGECSDSALASAASKTGAAEQASPSCPASSRIGSVNVAAGAGPSPFNAGGSAYLAGPYKGAPLSVAIITPALAGPFDLGTVVVRNALHIDPETAQVSVRSDPIPTQLQGIQLDVRSIDVNLDRNRFTLNPTNCERFAVTGSEVSSLGNTAALSDPFQVGECSKLGFKPKLSLRLSGKTKRTGHPALRAALTYPKQGNYANIARAQVTLPHSEFLDQSHIGTVCTRVQFAAGNGNGEQCPAASIYGHARAVTPLLDQPIEGPVYLRSSNHKLPDLVAALNGQISVDLDGKVDTGKGGGIRNTFSVVPDAPVSKFVLSLKGGKKGLLVNSENICAKPQKALAHFVAQSGKVDDFSPTIANSCPEQSRKAHKGGKAHR